MVHFQRVLSFIILAVLSTSCSSVNHSWKFTDRTWGNPSDFLTEMTGDSQTLSDRDLQTWVENSLLYNPNLGDRRPKVQVEDGVVTLSGDISSMNARRSIQNQIQSLNSVKGVRNLTHPLPTGSRRDPELSKDARLALALNSDLVGNNIDVFVNNGIIYLTGKVEDSSQKKLAGQIVALGRGSFVIKNQINILSFSPADG